MMNKMMNRNGTSSSTSAAVAAAAPDNKGPIILSSKRHKQRKKSKTSKLLWTVGTIVGIVVLGNTLNSLVHDGTLPNGITIILSHGNEETKWSLGNPGKHAQQHYGQQHPQQHLEPQQQQLHYLPPPRKLRNKLNKHKQEVEKGPSHQLVQKGFHKNRPGHHSSNAQHLQDYHAHFHHKPSQGLQQKQQKQQQQQRQDADQIAMQRLKEAAAKGLGRAQPVNGQQLQHQKEVEKGEVHTMNHFFGVSEKNGHDKERLLTLLRNNAGIRMLSQQSYDQLPSWGQVTSMYGDRPRLIGLEQCKAFQSRGDLADKFLAVAGAFNSGTNLLAKIVTRNCVLHKRQAKYGQKQRGIRWQVPYGKHTPPLDEEFRNSHVAAKSDGVDARNVLPAVMIRDPFRWLQSMCGHHYTSRWPRVFPRSDPRYHCPNLFPLKDEKLRLQELEIEPILEGNPPYEDDLKALFKTFNTTKEKEKAIFIGIRPDQRGGGGGGGDLKDQEDDTEDDEKSPNDHNLLQTEEEAAEILTTEELDRHYFPVRVKYSNFTREHRSLVHFYNEWYQEYLDLKDYPHILIRMEDLLFFPDEVVPQICHCAGGQLVTANATKPGPHPIKVVAQSAKAKHSTKYMAEGEEHTGYLDALIKYGKSDTRFRGMTSQDLQYAGRHLDANIMDLFGYDYPDKAPVSPQAQ